MDWPGRWARRIAMLTHRADVERDMDAEMRHHIECETRELVARGVPPDEARRQALVAFGGVERFKEEGRDARGVRLWEDLVQDVRFAVRALRRNPTFTTATILTFGLGVGSATAILCLVYGVIFRPLPYSDPSRLVVVWERDSSQAEDRNVVAVSNFEAWRDRNRSFEDMAALVPKSVTIGSGSQPERIVGAQVSPGYFHLLGVTPERGREFTTTEGENGGADVVILSHGYWQQRFGGDRSVVGRTMPIGERVYTIVGIMPEGFEPPHFFWLGDQDLWFPFSPTVENRSWGRFLLVIARLRPDVTLEQGRLEMAAIERQRASEDPSDQGWSTTVVGLADQITGDVKTSLLVILAAVGLLLLMAVANVAALMLAFARRREDELAVRRALGATGPRLLRQLLTQSALLAILGGAAGLLTAVWSVRMLVHLLPSDVPRVAAIQVDSTVLLLTLCTTALATLIFGSIIVARGTSGRSISTLHRGSPGRVAVGASGAALVVAEVGLGLVLAVFASLMVRSWSALHGVKLGFASEGVVAARVALPGGSRYSSADGQRAFFDALLEHVRSLPGVRSASLISTRPFGGPGPATGVWNPARPVPAGSQPPVADVRFVDPTFFQTLRIPVVAGATFDGRDNPHGPPRVIINHTMARELWSSENPVGRQVAIDLFGGISPEIIGVVGDVHLIDVRTPPRPTAYLSASQFPSDTRDLVVRGDGDPNALLASLRLAVAELDHELPLYQRGSLEGIVDASLARDRFTTYLLSGFAFAALLLAAVGVFGVFSGEVVRRRREIGIRLALGSPPSRLTLMVLGQGLARAATGVAAGIVVALALGRPMASIVFGVTPSDPLSFLAVAAVLFGVAAVATLIPAIAAGRVSPLRVMRSE